MCEQRDRDRDRERDMIYIRRVCNITLLYLCSVCAIFMYIYTYICMYICKHPHHPPERCLRHGVEGVFKVNVDPMNSLALSPSFLLDEVHPFHVNADATSLPASTLPWF